jgi:hypothetical protein
VLVFGSGCAMPSKHKTVHNAEVSVMRLKFGGSC